MPQDEPNSGGVGPEVQEATKSAFSQLSSNLTAVIKPRLRILLRAGSMKKRKEPSKKVLA